MSHSHSALSQPSQLFGQPQVAAAPQLIIAPSMGGAAALSGAAAAQGAAGALPTVQQLLIPVSTGRSLLITPLYGQERKVSSLEGDPFRPSGYDACLPSMSSQVLNADGSPIGLAWLLYKCAALWRAVYGSYATKTPLGTIRLREGNFYPIPDFHLVAIWPKLLKAM